MAGRRSALRGIALLVTVLSCTDGSTVVGPDAFAGGGVMLRPSFSLLASSVLPINRIRVTVLSATTRVVISVQEFEVDPAAVEWSLDVTIPTDVGPVILQIEGLHVYSSNEVVVEFSGESSPISPGSAASGAQAEVEIPVYSGPLTNLHVISVTIHEHISMIVEGSTLALLATATTSGSTTPTIYWESLTPDVANVDPDGLLHALVPGTTRIVAAAGPHSDTTTVEVRAAIADVSVSPMDVTVTGNGVEVLFEATVRDRRGQTLPDQSVDWSSSDPLVAAQVVGGRFLSVSPGVTTITAAVSSQSDTRATTTLTVVLDQAVSSVYVEPSATTIAFGTSGLLAATARNADGVLLTDKIVNWTTSDASVVTVDAAGLITGVGPGQAVVTATVDGVSGSATITVSPKAAASVVIAPAAVDVAEGMTVQLVARVFADDGSELVGREVSWASGDPTFVEIDSHGLATGIVPGHATITAASGTATGTSSIFVIQAPVRSVTVTPPSGTFMVGTTLQFSARLQRQDGTPITGRVVAWSTADGSVASVNSDGLVTAISPGTTSVTATSEGVTGTATLTVTAVPVANVVVTPSSATIDGGQTVQLAAETRDANGTTLTGRTVTWTSSDASIATVDASGLVTGILNGTVTITATSEGISSTASVTILRQPVSMVVLTPGSVTLTVGSSVQFVAELRDASSVVLTGRTITWALDNPAVATLYAGGLVVGVAPGTATVSATSEGVTGTAAVTVTPVPVASVVVTPVTASIDPGASVQLTADPRDSGNTSLSGRTITWTSSDVSIATVDLFGLVTGVLPGSVIITATSDGVSGTASLTVNAPTGTVMACGDLVSSEILSPGGMVAFNFIASGGEVLVVTVAHTSGFTNWAPVRLKVLDPSGVQMLVLTSNTRQHIGLPVPGVYTVWADANDGVGTGTFNMGFECLAPTVSSDGVLVRGTFTDATLSAPGEVDLYTFSGTSGDIISLATINSGGFDPWNPRVRATLFDDVGTFLGEVYGNNRSFFTLPKTGSFSVMVDAQDVARTGSYRILIDDVIPPRVSAGPIAAGDLLSGTISTTAQIDIYTMAATAGDILAFTLTHTSGFDGAARARMGIYNSAGTWLFGFDGTSRRHFTVPATGSYYVMVDATDFLRTGTYNLGLDQLAPTVSSDGVLVRGTFTDATLSAPGEVDLYTFSGTSGDIISLATINSGGFDGWNPRVRATLFDDVGTFLGEVYGNNRSFFTLPKTGSFSVMVDAQNFARTGSYRILIFGLKPPDPITLALPFNTATQGSLAGAGESHIYTFNAVAATSYNAAIAVISGFSPALARVTVYAPDGSLVGSIGTASTQQGFAFTAATSGNYVFVVDANDIVSTGTYQVTVF